MYIIVAIFISFMFSQEDCIGGRYLEEIFNVDVQYEIEYGENINQNLLGVDYTQTLYMDIYSPENDELSDRPLIFFMFGGSFIGGSKSSGDIVALCTQYAQRGYVAVAIDYRLSPVLIFNPTEEVAYKAVLKAIHDVKAAIRYFRMMDELSQETYRIDSNRIFVGGVSAGAIAAVNSGYLDEYEEIPSFLLDDYDDFGGFEGTSGNDGYDSSFHGIVNLCGAVGDQYWIVENDIPVVSMHGDQDSTVPYDDNLVTLFGLNIQIDGSYIIHQRMQELGNYSALHTYVGQDHVPFSSNLELEVDFTSSFLYDVICSDDGIAGDINGDEEINVLDIVSLVNIILSGEFQTSADLNDDEDNNVLDIVILIQMILDT